MSSPTLSVVTCWFRPGGIDILMAGMRDQTYPRDRFEVIVVDRRYEQRHDAVMKLARQYDVPLIHVPEHRRNGIWGCTASAYNTGLALARGETVVFLQDWTYAPPGWIEAHLRAQAEAPRVCVAPYLYLGVALTQEMHERLFKDFLRSGHIVLPWEAFMNQPGIKTKCEFNPSSQMDREGPDRSSVDAVLEGEVFDEISVFEEGLFDPAWLPRMPPIPYGDPGARKYPKNIRLGHVNTHLKNESFPRKAAYAINGLDIWGERGGRMQIDIDFGLRMEALGLPLLWEPDAYSLCVNPRHGICRHMPVGTAFELTQNRWDLAHCQAYEKRRQSEIVTRARIPAPAPYTLNELATSLEPWRTAPSIDTAGIEQSDAMFFGRDIWPDSPYDHPTAPAPLPGASYPEYVSSHAGLEP